MVEETVEEKLKRYYPESEVYRVMAKNEHVKRRGERLLRMLEIKHGELIKYDNLGEL